MFSVHDDIATVPGVLEFGGKGKLDTDRDGQ